MSRDHTDLDEKEQPGNTVLNQEDQDYIADLFARFDEVSMPVKPHTRFLFHSN